MDFGTPEHELALKRYIIAMLIQEAQADGEFSNIEKKYLNYAAREIGLSDAEVVTIRLNPTAYDLPPNTNENERMVVLYYLLFMLQSDKNSKKEEEIICHHVGFRLGFRRDLISDLINQMKDCIDKQLPPTDMLEVIKPYLN